jgi:hypothetical protein
MKQILHIFKKDLLRYAWAWITLACCAAIEIYLRGTTTGLLDSDLNQGLEMLSSMISGILFFTVIVMVVQEETLADPDAYWLSRPINRGKLLASKLCFLLLLIGIHQVADVIILCLNGGASRIPYALLGTLSALAIWQSQVFLAAQTRSLPRYLLLIVCIFVGFYALSFAMLFLTFFSEFTSFDLNWGLLPSTLPAHWMALIQTLYWLIIGLGILYFLYSSRRILLSWLILIPAIIGSIALTPDKHFLGNNLMSYLENGEKEKQLTLEYLQKGGIMQTNGEEYIEVIAVFSLKGIPRETDIWSTVMSPNLELEGKSIELNEIKSTQKFQSEGDQLRSIRIGYAKRDELKGNESNISLRFTQQITFSNQIEVGSLALTEGAAYIGAGNRLVLRSTFRDNNVLNVEIASTIPSYSFEPGMSSAHNEAFNGKFSFALANQMGQKLNDFQLSASWQGMGISSTGTIQTELPENAELTNYQIIVFAREITGSIYDHSYRTDIAFIK